MNGDLLTNLDFHALVEFHRAQNATLTIGVHARDVKIDLGVLQFNGNFEVTNYIEKPRTTYHVSMGIYVYEPRALHYVQPGLHLDFPELVLRLLENGERVCAFPSQCLWLDIGRPADYAHAQRLFNDKKEAFELV
jgi:NDP-sugar pyrophosphorylase family protein